MAEPRGTPPATCVLCGARDSREVHRGVRFAPGAAVRACEGCDLVFLWPRPDTDDLVNYYRRQYRAEYLDRVAPEDTYRRVVTESRARVERLRRHLRPTMAVLDVGASAGAFLEAVRPHVETVLGVEPDDAHRSWVAARLAVPMVRDIAELEERRFDVIGLFHTLEHVPDPVGFLHRLAVLLQPGGFIAIEVPCVTDALVALYRIPAFLASYYQRAHLSYFAEKTLARTIEAAGGRSQITGLQRYDLSNHLRWALTGQPGGQGYYADVLTEEVQSAYARALIRAGHADTLWALASFREGDRE